MCFKSYQTQLNTEHRILHQAQQYLISIVASSEARLVSLTKCWLECAVKLIKAKSKFYKREIVCHTMRLRISSALTRWQLAYMYTLSSVCGEAYQQCRDFLTEALKHDTMSDLSLTLWWLADQPFLGCEALVLKLIYSTIFSNHKRVYMTIRALVFFISIFVTMVKQSPTA